jgi:solute carrier family 35 (UDP-sugar transporter), member A1/2/3
LKYSSLLLLTFQNASLALVMRYVRTRAGNMFFSSTAVVSSEVLKLIICFIYVLIEQKSVAGFLQHLNDNIVKQPMDCVKVSVPAIIYIITNNLLYVASSNLDAATQQVCFIVLFHLYQV